ncbi:MAG: hypothetical protein GXP42_05810 [Chloroflexi bacterium]|nr:hypothetical protein [Chloroflexota bacterium]
MSSPPVDVQEIEHTLVEILRVLPPERAAELVDFAEFLKERTLAEEAFETKREETPDEDEVRWDRLLASEKGQRLLEELAAEAVEDIDSGQTTEIDISSEGLLAPR